MQGVGADLATESARWLGRRVVVPALRACGACAACRRGHAGLCARVGVAIAGDRRARVAARLVVPLADEGAAAAPGVLAPPAEPAFLAALAGIGLDAYAALLRAGVEPNRAAIVLGRGPLPRFVAALVQHRGAAAVRVPSPDDGAEAMVAAALGAVESFGVPLIDARPRTDAHALALARPGGTVVLCGEAGALDAAAIAARGLAVVAAGRGHPDLLAELCAFVAQGALALAPLCRLVDDPAAARATSPDDERVAILRTGGG